MVLKIGNTVLSHKVLAPCPNFHQNMRIQLQTRYLFSLFFPRISKYIYVLLFVFLLNINVRSLDIYFRARMFSFILFSCHQYSDIANPLLNELFSLFPFYKNIQLRLHNGLFCTKYLRLFQFLIIFNIIIYLEKKYSSPFYILDTSGSIDHL